METSFLIETLKGATELANALRVRQDVSKDARSARETQAAIEALRLIYFSPIGVLRIIEDLANGRQPNGEEVATILPEFNDYEFRVQRNLGVLDGEWDRNSTLTLRAQRVLREISYGKAGVRQRVKELLNESLTFENGIEPEDAAELLDQILALNKAIEDAEEALVLSQRR